MGKFRKQIGLILCMLLICSLSGITVSGQQSSLEIIGTAEYDMTPLANARVSLTKDGSTVQTIYTNTKGEFRFYLDINSEYVISVDKEGLLGKKIALPSQERLIYFLLDLI